MNDFKRAQSNTLDGWVARLPADISPPSSLWYAIERRLHDRHGEVDSMTRRLPASVEPPVDLWPGISERLLEPSAAGTARGWPRAAAAAVGVLAVALLVALSALRVAELETAPTEAAYAEFGVGSDDWWITRLNAVDGIASPTTAVLLKAALQTIRDNYELARQQRLAIEAAMQRDLDDPNLRALWAHAYGTELSLAGRAERILNDQQRGIGI